MYPRQDDRTGLYGFWDRDGWAVHPQFGYAHRFVSGHAAVDLVDGRSGLIRSDGRILLLDEICGGKESIQDEHYSFTGFGGGYQSLSPRYAVVRTKNGAQPKWGLLDSQLNFRPLTHDAFTTAATVKACTEHVVIFHASGRGPESVCGLFNLKDGRLDLPIEFSSICPSKEQIWVVSRTVGETPASQQYYFYDVSKRDILPGSFSFALPFSCGLGAVRVGEWNSSGRSYFVDKDLRPAFNAEFDEVGPFSYDLAAVYDNGDAGYIDTTGELRLLLPYVDLQPFNELGLAIANRDNEEWDIDIIDREGQPRLSELETAVFWEGDFPYFEITIYGEEHLYDFNLVKLF